MRGFNAKKFGYIIDFINKTTLISPLSPLLFLSVISLLASSIIIADTQRQNLLNAIESADAQEVQRLIDTDDVNQTTTEQGGINFTPLYVAKRSLREKLLEIHNNSQNENQNYKKLMTEKENLKNILIQLFAKGAKENLNNRRFLEGYEAISTEFTDLFQNLKEEGQKIYEKNQEELRRAVKQVTEVQQKARMDFQPTSHLKRVTSRIGKFFSQYLRSVKVESGSDQAIQAR